MNFKDLVKPSSIEPKIITVDGNEISVKQYLSADDRYDLIYITLQNAYDDGIYDKTKLDVYFHLGLIYLYTDIEFTDEDREDEGILYDYFMVSGVMNQVIDAIPANQYQELWKTLNDTANDRITYNNTAAGVLTKIINDLPKNAEIARDTIENFDPEKFQEVLNFAKAANGGRNIFADLMPTSK